MQATIDQKAADKTFESIHNLKITEAAVRAHVIRPANVEGVVSSKGLEDLPSYLERNYNASPANCLDVNGFAQTLHQSLKDSVVGYAMQLRQHGTTIYTVIWNWAQTPADKAEGWATNVRIHVASCSKIITAIAMTKLLNDKNISYDTPIIGFLPAYWAKGPNINLITFRHLMTHTSGFITNSSDSTFGLMESKVAAGVASVGQYNYENMNFGLCRILIATVNGNISPDAVFFLPENDLFWDLVTIQAYVQYVQNNIFMPANVVGPTLDHGVGDALAYNFPTVGNGWNSGDLTTEVGGLGWHMSVEDLLAIMGTFRRNGSIMTPPQAQTLLDSSFGIDQQIVTPLGMIYNKNGAWGNSARQVEQAVAFYLPQDMELVAVTNSPIGNNSSFRGLVTNAYFSNIIAC